MANFIGIDLGTTFSALAILNSIGRPEIVPNAEGERITPSAISFDEEDSQTIHVGVEAINSRYLNPQRCVRWIKRHMGDPNFHVTIDGRDWTAVELSSLILKKLKQDASVENGPVTDVVISVPAHFDEIRRRATMDAGTMAGLNVIGIVNEPVAAALYYATTRSISGKVLVYDLGGGTFDVTIMNVNNQDIDIICSQGDHALGGVDFDHKILELFEAAYMEEFETALIGSEEERAKYEDEAEDIKKTLSRRTTAKTMLYGSAGNVSFEITREAFEKAIAPLIGRTQMLLEVALDEASLKPSQIDRILLVGGSTRIPVVANRLTQMFGRAPEVAVNVDEAVALGAAVHAGLTVMRDNPATVPAGVAGGLRDIKLKDVCNHSYGTLCARLNEETGQRVAENYIILKKNTPLPCGASRLFYTVSDNQKELQAIITQGEDTNPEYVNRIAAETFELPPGRPANRPVRVTYSYDVNQRMHCKFEDLDSGGVLEVNLSIDKDGQCTQEEARQRAGELAAFQVE
jgi:molecular chaperone DnaK